MQFGCFSFLPKHAATISRFTSPLQANWKKFSMLASLKDKMSRMTTQGHDAREKLLPKAALKVFLIEVLLIHGACNVQRRKGLKVHAIVTLTISLCMWHKVLIKNSLHKQGSTQGNSRCCGFIAWLQEKLCDSVTILCQRKKNIKDMKHLTSIVKNERLKWHLTTGNGSAAAAGTGY